MEDKFLTLICATKGRYEELDRLLNSLATQTTKNFDIILIDQNTDDRVFEIVGRYSMLAINQIRLSESNSTKARNVGAKEARGKWLGFPDDDSWMPPDFVERLIDCIRTDDNIDGVFTNWRDPLSGRSMFSFEPGLMEKEDPFTLASCICIFFSKQCFFSVAGFDERLGLGDNTLLKAGEEQDLLLKMMNANKRILKAPHLEVYHLIREKKWDSAFVQRIISQGACDISFHKKYNGWRQAYSILLYWMAGIIVNLLRGRMKSVKWYYYKLLGGVFYQFEVR